MLGKRAKQKATQAVLWLMPLLVWLPALVSPVCACATTPPRAGAARSACCSASQVNSREELQEQSGSHQSSSCCAPQRQLASKSGGTATEVPACCCSGNPTHVAPAAVPLLSGTGVADELVLLQEGLSLAAIVPQVMQRQTGWSSDRSTAATSLQRCIRLSRFLL